MAIGKDSMNLNEQQLQLLNQLQDIQLPEPIGWWPLSTTWWMLLFMVGTLLIGVIWYFLERKKRNAYREEAMEALHKIDRSNTANQQVLEINRLLKQVALTAYARTDVAQLSDQSWLAFLSKTAKHINQPSQLLQGLQMAYQTPSQEAEQIRKNQQALTDFKHYASQWIKGHHQ